MVRKLGISAGVALALAVCPPAVAAGPGASCSPGCTPPLVKVGGATAVTQASPTVFLIFWGPAWSNPRKLGHTTVMGAAVKLFTGLAGDTGAAQKYNGLLRQYLGAANAVPSYGGEWVDPAAPASSLQSSDFQHEVDRAIGQNEGWFAGQNVQFVIFPQEIAGDGKRVKVSFAGEEKPDFCAYHDYRTTGTVNGIEVYDVEPWLGRDASCLGYGTGSGFGRIATAMTTVATHEYAEAATDPFWNSTTGQKGWQTNQPGSLYEIGDLCAYRGVVEPGLGAVQYLWSNAARHCTTG